MTLVRLLLLLAVFIAGIYVYALGISRSSLPNYDGELELKGLNAAVTVARDEHGVPHISASNEEDLNFALGYVHAQDRLFQMEMNRRIGNGELSEVLGALAAPADRLFRTLGFKYLSASAYNIMPEDGRKLMDAYVAGVNTFIENNRGAWAPGFEILDFEPRPWTAVDSLVWQKLMWLDLSGNGSFEAVRAQLLTKLTPEQVTALYPLHPGDSEKPLPRLEDIYPDLPLAEEMFGEVTAALGGEPTTGYGSNNWVVSGAMTKSGKPLLANDPHLGLTTPSIWYLARLHNTTTGSNVVGVGFPGLPGIVLGRNDRIAWGFTNTNPDIQDLFVEKLVGDDQYLTPDGPVDLIKRKETILVRGGDPIEITVRTTRHGPLVSDLSPEAQDLLKEGYAVALQWTALQADDTGSYGIFGLMEAQNFDDFVAAGQYYLGPQQNMIFADVDGNIGYHAPARVPVRHPDNQVMGRIPSPGWDPLYDWQGYVPMSEVPKRYNPDSGMIATANERIVDDSYPHFITRDWSTPYRGNRIRAQLSAKAPHDPESFQTLHGDIISDMVRDLKPLLIEAAGEGASTRGQEVIKQLSAWNGSMDKDLTEPLLFHTWLRSFQTALIKDEIGDALYTQTRGLKPVLLKSALYHSLGKTAADTAYYALPPLGSDVSLPWCDDVSTDAVETCQALAVRSLDAALEQLESRYGPDPATWTWGSVHLLTQSNRPFGQFPGLGGIFQLGSPQDGGRYTINVAGNSSSPTRPHVSGFGPSYRGIFDFADLDNSLLVQPTGQSEHPASPYFGNMFPLWQDVNYIRIPTDKPVPENAVHILELKPVSR